MLSELVQERKLEDVATQFQVQQALTHYLLFPSYGRP
jgi:hypothetical protein